MSLFWWRRERTKRKAARRQTPSPRRKSRWQMSVEQLEDRVTPAVHYWVGGDPGNPHSMFDNNNWRSTPGPAGAPGFAPTEPDADIVFQGFAGVDLNPVDDIPASGVITAGGVFHSVEIQGAGYTLSGSDVASGFALERVVPPPAGPATTPSYILFDAAGPGTSTIALNVNLRNAGGPTAAQEIDSTGANSLVISGAITGGSPALALEINGPIPTLATGAASPAVASAKGNVVFSGVNTYAESTYVADGTLILRNNGALGAAQGTTYLGHFNPATSPPATHIAGATPSLVLDNVTITGNTLEIDDASAPISLGSFGTSAWTGNIILNAAAPTSAAGAVVINVASHPPTPDAAGTLTLSGSISNINGAAGFIKMGGGKLILSGAVANTFAGAVTVSSGILNLQKSTALGSTGMGTTLNNASILQLQGGIHVGPENLTINGTSGLRVENVSGNNTWDGNIVLDVFNLIPSPPFFAEDTTIAVDNAADTLTLGGVISELIGGEGITKTGPGTLFLTNTGPGADVTDAAFGNTYTGTTTVLGGILRGGKTDAFGTGAGPAGMVSVLDASQLQFVGVPQLAFTFAPPQANPEILIPNLIDLASTNAFPLENLSGFTGLTGGVQLDFVGAPVPNPGSVNIASDAGKLFIGLPPIATGGPGGGGPGISIAPGLLAVTPTQTFNVTITRVTQGGGAVEYDADNNYNGTTFVLNGELDLNAPFGAGPTGVAAIPGPLVVGDAAGTTPGTVKFLNVTGVSQFASLGFPTTINKGSQLIVAPGVTAPIGPLTLNNANVTLQATPPFGPAGILQLNADVTETGTSNIFGPFTALGAVDLNGATRTFNVGAGGSLFIGSAITNLGGTPAGLTMNGAAANSTMVLSNVNTYDGPTTITGGVLDVNGFQPQSSVFVNGATSTLGGTGFVGPVKVNGGTVNPAGPGATGTLTVEGPLTFDSTYAVDLAGTSAAQVDMVNVQGQVNLNGATLNVNAGGLAAPAGSKFVIMTASGGIVGNFAAVTGAQNFSVAIVGNQVVLTLNATQAAISTPTITVNGVPATTSLFGQPVTVSVTLTPPPVATPPNPALPPPTGTVTFFDNGVPFATVPVTPGAGNTVTATVTTSTLSVGGHTITARYSGDANFASVTSAAATVTVNPSPTTLTLAPVPNVAAGNSVTLQATITPTSQGNVAPTGLVNFTAQYTPTGGGTAQTLFLGSAPVSGNKATLVTQPLAGGSYVITATYTGDGNYTGSSATQATAVTASTVATTTTVGAVPTTTTLGQQVVLSATISGGAGGAQAPTGTVTFRDTTTNTVLGTAPVTNGVASATVSTTTLGVGPHAITASYSGDASNAPSTSTPVTVTVNTIGTNVSLSVTPQTGPVGSTFLVNVSVAPTTPGGPTPTGTVTVRDTTTNTVLGTINLTNGAGSLSVPNLAVGNHSITASYSGDASNTASTSGPFNVTVTPITSAVTLNAIPNQVQQFGSVLLTANVSGGTGGQAPTGTVTFKDGATTIATATVVNGVATFATNSLALGSHSITAVYSGDVNNNAATSNAAQVSVVSPQVPGPLTPQNTVINNFFQIKFNTVKFSPSRRAFVVPVTLRNVSGINVIFARAFLVGLTHTITNPSGFASGVPGITNGTPFIDFSTVPNEFPTLFLFIKAPSAAAARNFALTILAGQ